MEKTQFHKYQICEWEGREGVIIRTDYPDKGTIQFAFDNGYLYFTHDGRITPNSPVSLRPVGEARRVLTEWQRKRLMECHWMKNKFIMDDIESILSTPEPAKWIPKKAILFWLGIKTSVIGSALDKTDKNMKEKFYVGQRVKSDQYGDGSVLNISNTRYPGFPVYVSFKNAGIAYSSDGVLMGGSSIDLHPAEPKPVLTEWQEKELRRLLGDWTIQHIKSILSTPEPVKWMPKENEPVLVMSKDSSFGFGAAVATGNGNEAYMGSGCAIVWDVLIPFDASLIGTTDNP